MKQRNLIFLFCAVLLVAGCTEKKQNHMKSSDFEASRVLKDSMPEPVKLDSDLLSNAGTVVPYFPGGLKAMRAFIAKHMRYPEAARTLKKRRQGYHFSSGRHQGQSLSIQGDDERRPSFRQGGFESSKADASLCA